MFCKRLQTEKSILESSVFVTSNSKDTAGIPESVSFNGMKGENAVIFTLAGNEASERETSAKGKNELLSDFSKKGRGIRALGEL